MDKPRSLFRFGTVSAGASLFTIILLMVGPTFLVPSIVVSIVYAAVPCSLWRKHRSRKVRVPIALTCVLGFGIVLSGIALELWSTTLSHEPMSAAFPGMISLAFTLIAGVVFLPLAAIGSIHTLLGALRDRRKTVKPTN